MNTLLHTKRGYIYIYSHRLISWSWLSPFCLYLKAILNFPCNKLLFWVDIECLLIKVRILIEEWGYFGRLVVNLGTLRCVPELARCCIVGARCVAGRCGSSG